MWKVKKTKRFDELAHNLLNTEQGKMFIEALYRREVLVKKDFSNPTELAAQTARSDLVLTLVNIAKIPEGLLRTYTELEKVDPVTRNDMIQQDDWD